MLFARWRIGEHFRLIHFAKRLNRELKACILHSVRRFASMISAVAEWKVSILGVNAANYECNVPILGVNVAVWQRETPAGLPDAAYPPAFLQYSTCNRAKSVCVSNHYLLQCGGI